MNTLSTSLVLATGLLSLSQISHAQTEIADQPPIVEYSPAGPWTVDYAEDSCALYRTFEAQDRELWMELRQIAPDSLARVSVGSGHLELTEDDPHVTIFPAREAFDHWAKPFTTDDDSIRAIVTSLRLSLLQSVAANEDDSSEALPEIAGVQIARAFNETVVIQTGEMDMPLQALETCLEDLVRTWGIEPEQLRNAVTKPVPAYEDQWRARVRNYYPRTGKYRSRNTRFPVVLLVGPDGKVARCRSPNALGDEDFEAVACAALTRFARFEPALDAKGEATYGFWSTNMVYITI